MGCARLGAELRKTGYGRQRKPQSPDDTIVSGTLAGIAGLLPAPPPARTVDVYT